MSTWFYNFFNNCTKTLIVGFILRDNNLTNVIIDLTIINPSSVI